MNNWDRMDGIIANPTQLASYLMQTLIMAYDYTDGDIDNITVPLAFLHWHDDASMPIAWNNVQSIIYYNRTTGANLDVPLTATEGYSEHGHVSKYDGGYIPGRNIADLHFSVFHPGSSLPQVVYAI